MGRFGEMFLQHWPCKNVRSVIYLYSTWAWKSQLYTQAFCYWQTSIQWVNEAKRIVDTSMMLKRQLGVSVLTVTHDWLLRVHVASVADWLLLTVNTVTAPRLALTMGCSGGDSHTRRSERVPRSCAERLPNWTREKQITNISVLFIHIVLIRLHSQ